MADKKKAKKKSIKKKAKKRDRAAVKMGLVKKPAKKPRKSPETPEEKIQLLEAQVALFQDNTDIARREAAGWQKAADREAGLKKVYLDEVAFLKDTIRSLNAKFTGDKKP